MIILILFGVVRRGVILFLGLTSVVFGHWGRVAAAEATSHLVVESKLWRRTGVVVDGKSLRVGKTGSWIEECLVAERPFRLVLVRSCSALRLIYLQLVRVFLPEARKILGVTLIRIEWMEIAELRV